MTAKPAIVKHKRPKGLDPSKLVLQYADDMAHNLVSPVADVACGYGRNALYLAERGCEVYCLDNNTDALSSIAALEPHRGKLHPIEINLATEEWPYQSNALGGVINVHYFSPELIPYFIKSLKQGGFLLIETVDNRCGNYLSLPKKYFIRDQLKDGFDLLYYQERKAGPDNYDAVTLKVFARKRVANGFL